MICVCGVYCSWQETKTKQPSDVQYLTAVFCIYLRLFTASGQRPVYQFVTGTGCPFLAGRPSLGTINVMMMKASVDIAPEMEKATIQPRLTATAAPIPPPKMEATALAAQKQP